jgi:hypothetical protein
LRMKRNGRAHGEYKPQRELAIAIEHEGWIVLLDSLLDNFCSQRLIEVLTGQLVLGLHFKWGPQPVLAEEPAASGSEAF